MNIWHLARCDISLFHLLDGVFEKIYGKVGKLVKNLVLESSKYGGIMELLSLIAGSGSGKVQ